MYDYVLNNSDKWIFARLRAEVNNNTQLPELRDHIIRGEESVVWEARDGLNFLKGKVYMDAESALVQEAIAGFHNFRHEGVQKTMGRIRRDIYWKGYKKAVQDFIRDR